VPGRCYATNTVLEAESACLHIKNGEHDVTGPYERTNLNIRVQWLTGSFTRAQQNFGYAFISGVVCP